MRASSYSIADEIERYLRTGEADMMGNPWPGDIMERGGRQHADIRGALLEEVRRLSKARTHEAVPDNVGVAFTRAKVEQMVRGLFPKAEQEVVLATLERSVVYVTSETIESIILNHGWDRSAWDLANLYLLSVGAELLGPDAPRVVGISEETTCYVSRTTSPRTTRSPTSSSTRRRTSSTTASGARSDCARRARRSGCSTSSTGSARRSPTRARLTPVSWPVGRARASDELWPPSTWQSRASLKNASTRPRSRASSRRRPPHGTAGR